MIGHVRMFGWLLLAMQMIAVVNGADQPEKEKQPDPLELLKTVAQARQKIASGEMEFEVIQYDFAHPLDRTNHVRLKVVFDGEKRRFESFSREYRCVLMGPDGNKVTDAKRLELGLDREAAVQAGLLERSESHHVTAYDGAVLMDYWANDDRPFQTKIDDPSKGSFTYVFDPRVLGLTPSEGKTLGDRAKPELFELQRLGVGKVAPEIEGEDVDGRRFQLSEYRGKVVVIDFWGDW